MVVMKEGLTPLNEFQIISTWPKSNRENRIRNWMEIHEWFLEPPGGHGGRVQGGPYPFIKLQTISI